MRWLRQLLDLKGHSTSSARKMPSLSATHTDNWLLAEKIIRDIDKAKRSGRRVEVLEGAHRRLRTWHPPGQNTATIAINPNNTTTMLLDDNHRRNTTLNQAATTCMHRLRSLRCEPDGERRPE